MGARVESMPHLVQSSNNYLEQIFYLTHNQLINKLSGFLACAVGSGSGVDGSVPNG